MRRVTRCATNRVPLAAQAPVLAYAVSRATAPDPVWVNEVAGALLAVPPGGPRPWQGGMLDTAIRYGDRQAAVALARHWARELPSGRWGFAGARTEGTAILRCHAAAAALTGADLRVETLIPARCSRGRQSKDMTRTRGGTTGRNGRKPPADRGCRDPGRARRRRRRQRRRGRGVHRPRARRPRGPGRAPLVYLRYVIPRMGWARRRGGNRRSALRRGSSTGSPMPRSNCCATAHPSCGWSLPKRSPAAAPTAAAPQTCAPARAEAARTGTYPASDRLDIIARAADIAATVAPDLGRELFGQAVDVATGINDDAARLLAVHADLASRASIPAGDRAGIAGRLIRAGEAVAPHVTDAGVIPYAEIAACRRPPAPGNRPRRREPLGRRGPGAAGIDAAGRTDRCGRQRRGHRVAGTRA